MMEKEIIQHFWAQRASTGQTRWTNSSFLEYELETLRNFELYNTRILDLGSGFGELSRQLCGPNGVLYAVDAEITFSELFNQQNYYFKVADVTEFRSTKTFDLILLFGVVTYLTLFEENTVYSNIASMKDPSGVVVVKNQCSIDKEFIYDGFSAELGCRYVGRYPSIGDQFVRLKEHFASVEVRPYPATFKIHETSEHVMFVCR
jgi:2-polyprenyl-3-methyl-5-hydroxy-6-metoxy-1,4-benzoquinol methylase